MTRLANALQEGWGAVGTAGLFYAVTVAVTASTALFARDPTRREDARATLTILLGRRL